MKKNFTLKISLLLLIFFIGCKDEQKKTEEPYFEGEITLSESRGLYGSLFKVHTTYTLSENYFKREQKLGGINSVFNTYAGVIVDLEKDSIVFYYVDELLGKKIKHTTSIKDYNTSHKYNTFPNTLPSPIDNTFNLLPDYNLIKQIKNSTEIKGFKSDYTLYKDESKIFKQEIYDSKDIKIKREFLEIVFPNIPDEINFVLKSDLKTTISDINNDSIINSKQSKAIDLFLRDIFQKSDEKTDLEKIANNKWVQFGLNILKKGIDLNINIKTNIAELENRKVVSSEFSFPSLGFKEIPNIDDFINDLPREGGVDFDD